MRLANEDGTEADEMNGLEVSKRAVDLSLASGQFKFLNGEVRFSAIDFLCLQPVLTLWNARDRAG